MKVLLLAEELGIGGLPNYVLSLARGLAEDGLEVKVAHGNAPLPGHLEVSDLPLLHLPGLTDTSSAPGEAVDIIRSLAPDVVHVHLCTNIPVIQGLLGSGIPSVRSFHDFTSLCLRRGRRRWPGDRCQRSLGWACTAFGCILSPPEKGGWHPRLGNLPAKIVERNAYRAFHASVVGSEFMAATLIRNGFSESKVHVVSHFSRFEEDASAEVAPEKRAGIPGLDRPFELLFSGQAVAGKGLEILISALAGLQVDWRLTVLARGPRLAPAQGLAESLGIAGRIDFAGWAPQSETSNHYRLADLLVIPSIWDDPIPLVGIEAMSFGTPLVGFAVGGIPDYLLPGETGVLVTDTTADALRSGLAAAMSDPHRLAIWGQTGRQLIARTCTKSAHLKALRRIYETAAGNHAIERNDLALHPESIL